MKKYHHPWNPARQRIKATVEWGMEPVGSGGKKVSFQTKSFPKKNNPLLKENN